MRALLGLSLACSVPWMVTTHPQGADLRDVRAAAEDARQTPATQLGRFDDGELTSPSGRWMPFTDRSCCYGSSSSTIEIVAGGAGETSGALSLSGETTANDVWVGAGALFWFPRPTDITHNSEIVFWARGESGSYRLFMFGRNPAKDIAWVEFTAGEEWEEIRIPISALSDVAPKAVSGFLFGRGLPPGTFSFQIDEVHLR